MEAKRKDTGSVALGRYLAAKRAALGLSYRELAQRLGKAPSTLQAWEQGKRRPDLEDLMALAHLLGADLAEMVDLAATPARELERRLAAAEERLRRLSNRSGPTEAGDRLEILETERQVAFLKNLLAARKKQEAGTRLPPRVVPLYDLKSVPVIGSIRAGKPRLAVEEALGYTAVPPDLEVDYALTVQGDSMIGAGIAPGDVVWVRQTDTARPGDTVVALLAGEEVTVKHLVQENGRYLLRANNPERSYPDLPLGPEDRIIGVVQRIVKRPGPPPKKPRADR